MAGQIRDPQFLFSGVLQLSVFSPTRGVLPLCTFHLPCVNLKISRGGVDSGGSSLGWGWKVLLLAHN